MKLVIRNCQIINHNYATENGGLYLEVTEQKSGLWVRAGVTGHQGEDLKILGSMRKLKELQQ